MIKKTKVSKLLYDIIINLGTFCIETKDNNAWFSSVSVKFNEGDTVEVIDSTDKKYIVMKGNFEFELPKSAII